MKIDKTTQVTITYSNAINKVVNKYANSPWIKETQAVLDALIKKDEEELIKSITRPCRRV